MKRLRKFVKFFLYFILLGFVSSFFLLLFLINDARREIKQAFLIEKRNRNQVSKNVLLESNSSISLSDLKLYQIFSLEDDNFESWLQKNSSRFIFQKNFNADDVFLSEDIKLKELIDNDCSDLYCFQSKIEFDSLPPKMWKGLIGIEDYRFLDHSGVDPISIARAIWVDIRMMRLAQGGSTLTQQLVKNLFLTNEKSFIRKFKELIYSIYLEANYSKEEILLTYFNEVFWGALDGIKVKGLYAASLMYFQKKPTYLTDFEMTILISLLKGPSYYSPIYHLERLKERANSILDKLIDLSLLPKHSRKLKWSEKEWDKWQKELLKLKEKRDYYEMWRTLKEKDHTLKNLNDYERYVFNQSVRKILIDVEKKHHFDEKKFRFSIKSIIGRIDSENNIFYYYSKYERNKQKAIDEEKHQIGSLVKPILYGIFLKHGLSLSHEVSGEKISLKIKSGLWEPKESTKFIKDVVTVEESVRRSLNWPTIRLAQEVGFENIEDDLKGYFPNLKTPLEEYPAQILGSIELDLNNLYNTYLKFIYDQCVSENFQGFDEKQNLFSVLSDPKTSTVRFYLKKSMENFKFFGKTGTTNNGVDNWYVAFTGSELFLIWFGLEDRSELSQDLKLYGSATSFRIFQEFVYHRGKRFPDFGTFFLKNSCESLQKRMSFSIVPISK